MIRAVIFDLDGLLANTEPLHSHAWRKTFSEKGIQVSEREYADHWVRQGKSLTDFLAKYNLTWTTEELWARKDQLFTQLVEKELHAMPGATKLLESLDGHIQMAIASSARRNPVDLVLRSLEMTQYFEFIATYEDVAPHIKPLPDVFLLVAQRLGVSPDECVVMEDAEKGILAAHRAGMRSIAVPNDHTRDNDFSKATLIVNSLEAVSLERIQML